MSHTRRYIVVRTTVRALTLALAATAAIGLAYVALLGYVLMMGL